MISLLAPFEVLKLFHLPIRKTLGLLAFGLLLIFILSRFTKVGQVGQLLLQFPTKLSVLVVLFLSFYLLIKFSLTRFLLGRLGGKVTWRRILVIFSAGELARELPVGFIFFTLFLTGVKSPYPVSLFAAAIVQPLMEVFGALILLALFGFGAQESVRSLAIAGILFMILIASLVRYFNLPKFLQAGKDGSGLWYRARVTIGKIKIGLGTLISLPTLLVSALLAIVYLTSLSVVLYLTTQSVNLTQISPGNAVSIFAFSFFWLMISPVPIDLGVTEGAGFLGLLNFGASAEGALAAMLAFRALISGTGWLVFSLASWFLFDEFRQALSKNKD